MYINPRKVKKHFRVSYGPEKIFIPLVINKKWGYFKSTKHSLKIQPAESMLISKFRAFH